MKSTINNSVIIIRSGMCLCLFFLLFVCTDDCLSQGNEAFVLEEEEYIDDIPFETSAVFRDIMGWNFEENDAEFLSLEPEGYIDDIPFNTEVLFAHQQGKLMDVRIAGLTMEEETYADDIPFDTELIASEAIYNSNCFPVVQSSLRAPASPSMAEIHDAEPKTDESATTKPASFNSMDVIRLMDMKGFLDHNYSDFVMRYFSSLKTEDLNRMLYRILTK